MNYPVIDLPVNPGLAGAFQTSIRYAFEQGYDAAIHLDADGQHDASCTGRLTAEMETKNADIVIDSKCVSEKNLALHVCLAAG